VRLLANDTSALAPLASRHARCVLSVSASFGAKPDRQQSGMSGASVWLLGWKLYWWIAPFSRSCERNFRHRCPADDPALRRLVAIAASFAAPRCSSFGALSLTQIEMFFQINFLQAFRLDARL
jgi:hypothetical protein